MNLDNGTRSTSGELSNREALLKGAGQGWIVGNPKTLESTPHRPTLGTVCAKKPKAAAQEFCPEETCPLPHIHHSVLFLMCFPDARVQQKKQKKLQLETGTMMLSQIVIKYLTSTLPKLKHKVEICGGRMVVKSFTFQYETNVHKGVFVTRLEDNTKLSKQYNSLRKADYGGKTYNKKLNFYNCCQWCETR